MHKWYLVAQNYKVEAECYLSCVVMKSQARDNIAMLCLVFDTDHLYALVISSVCVSFYICKVGRMPVMPISDELAINRI